MTTTTLVGPDAFNTLDTLLEKLRRARSMASVLNIAAFAKDVELDPADLQDFTIDLSAVIREAEVIANTLEIEKKVD